MPVRFRSFVPALIAVSCVLRPAHASTPSEQYLSLRHHNPPRPGLTLDLVAQSPDAYRGLTLEVAGKLAGIARTDEGASLILLTDKNGPLTLTMSRVPAWVQTGDRLRVLVVATGGQNGALTIGMPDLAVIALASASDIAVAEVRWRKEANLRQAREKQQKQSLAVAASTLRSSLQARAAPAPLSARDGGGSSSAVFVAYRSFIAGHNPRLSGREVDAITNAILVYSAQSDVDPRLVVALIVAESDFDTGATSRTGAMGLGQIMPGTAREIGLTNPYDPVQNVQGAIYLLKQRLDKYSGGAASGDLAPRHIVLALAAYNAGMGAVKKHGGVPPYRETQRYVKKVERIYRQLCGEGVGGA